MWQYVLDDRHIIAQDITIKRDQQHADALSKVQAELSHTQAELQRTNDRLKNMHELFEIKLACAFSRIAGPGLTHVTVGM